MTNLEKIKEIEETFNHQKFVFPAGKQIETLQCEIQIIIAKELCIINEFLRKESEKL